MKRRKALVGILSSMLVLSACSFSNRNTYDTEVVSDNEASSEGVSEESNDESSTEMTQNDSSIDSQISVIVKNRDVWDITYEDGSAISLYSFLLMFTKIPSFERILING